jgi:hypothetical protein
VSRHQKEKRLEEVEGAAPTTRRRWPSLHHHHRCCRCRQEHEWGLCQKRLTQQELVRHRGRVREGRRARLETQ